MRYLLIILFFTQIVNADDWFCTQESGKREGTTLWSCGIGDGVDEGQAREHALSAAFREFHMICDNSADCAGRSVVVNPQRTSCTHDARGFWTCTRLLVSTLVKD